MIHLPEEARDVVARLADVPGLLGLTLGGSRARGDAGPDADVDLGLYYDPGAPFDPAALTALARDLDDAGASAAPATPFGAWGPWVDGGAWLTVRGVRVDLLYRDLARAERGVEDALAGRVTLHAQVGHPHGVPGHHYAAELALAVVLADPTGRLAALRGRLGPYPPALGAALARTYGWQADFWLDAAGKGARRGDAWYARGCAFQAVAALVQVLCARGGAWLTNEKGAVRIAARQPGAPPGFEARVDAALPGPDLAALRALAAEVGEA